MSDLEIVIPADTRLGDVVIEAEGITKGFGDKLLIDDLTFSLPPAGIVGVIGANGAGKSTLFKMIIEAAEQAGDSDAQPDHGTLRIGPTVTLGYVDQDRTLDPDKTVYEEITGGVDNLTIGGREMHGRAYVASFNFRGSDQQKKVGTLSGGERNIISHDRWFLDRVATHILAFEGDSQVRWFEGNFTDYAEYRKREHGVDAMRPHRIKYKPVSRG